MLALLRSCVVATVLLVSLQLTGHQEDTQSPASDSGLAAANQLYRAGKFADAEASYQAVLKNDSKLVPAQVGLVRAMLGQQKLDEALTVVNTALVVQPNSAALLAAKVTSSFAAVRCQMRRCRISQQRNRIPKRCGLIWDWHGCTFHTPYTATPITSCRSRTFIGRDGKIVDRIIGLKGRAEIEDSIRKTLDTRGSSAHAASTQIALP